MLLPSLLNDTITVYPMVDGTEDRYGDAVEVRGDAAILPAHVEPVEGQEVEEGRDTRVTLFRAFTRPSEALTATSEVVWGGDSYEVVGEPKSFRELLGGPSHYETLIRRAEG